MSRNHYNIGPTRTAGPNRCGFCHQEWPCHGHILEEKDASVAAPRAEGLDVRGVLDRLVAANEGLELNGIEDEYARLDAQR